VSKPRKKPKIDSATKYAIDVAAGRIVAGPHVRDTCRRHLDDLESCPARGVRWDAAEAESSIDFFRDVLCLNGGSFEGEPFNPEPWQCFIIGSLFGWKDVETGCRRFEMAYIETGKGSGKSPLVAGIGLKGLVADGEPRAEIYAAATKKDQAMILFRDAVAMVEQSPQLSKRLRKSGTGQNVWNLAYLANGSFFRPISSDDGQSGPRPHMALLDEVHEHRSNTIVEMMRAGTKSRRQALIAMITNSGHNRQSVCWDYHDYACKVAAGQIDDDSFFSYVCALDLNDDPFNDESCWIKANPSLDAVTPIPGYNYLRKQVRQAKGMPAKESIVRRLNFCQWVEAESPWISRDVWVGCESGPYDDELLLGRRCWGGLDLSSTQDLTALVLLFEPTEDDPVWRLVPRFWLPGDGLDDKADKDRVPYLAWRDAGYLHTLKGRAVDRISILAELSGMMERYDLQSVAYDRWRIEDLVMMANREGIELPQMVPFGQGFKDMAPALDRFESMLLNREVMHDGNPVMTWCAANAVTAEDPAKNRKIAKDRATGRVDGIVAAVMACGILSNEGGGPSVYDQRAAEGTSMFSSV
jgi:phage terminase large subunit-like protein